MFLFDDPSLSELPAYISIASRGRAVLEHAHYNDHPGAIAWCSHAMVKVAGAEQLCIARPTVLEWLGFGNVPGMMPVEGWILAEDGWHQADPRHLLRTFEEVRGAPRTLQTEPPSIDGATLVGLTNRPKPSSAPVTRIAQPTGDAVVAALEAINTTLKRIADALPRS